ncbi:MAG: tRNA (adenosine(37)-N6)-dimethylallyltransferase MiaA [Sporolactobacillus sp.]
MDGKVIAVVGPTAVGKTKLGVYLGKHLNGEVINADASQIYRGMSIGTAKTTAEEQEGVPHHLLDLCDPVDAFSAADYQREARQVITRLVADGKQPILVGGTGFYIKSALYDYQFSNTRIDPAYRREMERVAQEAGVAALYEQLRAVDPEAAESIHPHNKVRVMRALEVFHTTGIPFSKQQRIPKAPIVPVLYIGLTMPRALLYQRIDARVDQMLAHGLVDEVRHLYDQGLAHSQALQAIGYKEFFPYFKAEASLSACVEQLKKNSRHYAKRQFTWFRGQMDVQWFEMSADQTDFAAMAEKILFVAREWLCQ